MVNNEEKKIKPMPRRKAASILILIFAPTVFIVVLLIAYGMVWLLPVLMLLFIIAAGIARKQRPDFFAALRKPKKASEVDEKPNPNPAFKPSSSARRSFMMLVGISNGSREHITINSSPFVIGRSDVCDYCIPDKYASKRHMIIEYVAEDMLCYATDVSSNGSYLNSVRMQNNIRRPLHQGDTLQIAGIMFRVEYVHF